MGYGMPSSPDRFTRNVDWNLLRTFHVIVQSANLSRAAAVLGRKQPAVSLSLSRLEAHLGARLCTRTSSLFELTPEGMRVAEICRIIFDQMNRLPNRLANLSPGGGRQTADRRGEQHHLAPLREGS